MSAYLIINDKEVNDWYEWVYSPPADTEEPVTLDGNGADVNHPHTGYYHCDSSDFPYPSRDRRYKVVLTYPSGTVTSGATAPIVDPSYYTNVACY